MLVYRTSYFNEQVEIQGIQEHIDRICQELEQMSLEAVQSRFERIYPYLKRKEGNLRLIARIRRFNKDYVLCWLTIFRRGDNDYENFLLKREFGHQSLDNVDETIKEWLKSKSLSEEKNYPSLLPLSSNLQIWLERPSWEFDNNGVVIYESQTWLDKFKVPEVQEKWLFYSELISKIADSEGNLGENTNWSNIRLYGENDCYLLFSLITTSDQPPRRVLLLIAPFLREPQSEEVAEIINNLTAIKSEYQLFIPDNNLNLLTPELAWDELTSLARRAYPSYLLADERLWQTIENDENTNLALSAEEEGILHAVSTSNPSLPLFLNGRAGSGKSTLLFHLFADYCYRHLRFCRENNLDFYAKPHPLFLAYNEPVTKYAQDRVMGLLESHHRFLAKRGQLEEVPNLSPFFQPFRLFLKNLLPVPEREFFQESKYISFYRFRQLMKAVWPEYSAELCWLVIRTFIKGYHLDERDSYSDINDYQEIPRRERIVSVTEFEDIYNNVWKWYEKHTRQNGEWDDQDLIRIVLQSKYYLPEYTAIFCDEAQDFTRLELQLVMRLSVFCNYDLEHEYIESLPFAFAGDPLQTLNPTGFRWSALKATFYNEIITALAPTGKLNLEMNFIELECNYRSINSIVGVSNLIQLWRQQLCNISEIRPQQSRKYGNFQPQKFILDVNINREVVKPLLQDAVIIIPCDEGGEVDYIKADELLCSFIPAGSEEIPWNILSAISVKGLEFKQVILYKFGEFCPSNLWEKNDQPTEEGKYFLNKLYVAASRATEKLFILDSELGENLIWKHAVSEAELNLFLNNLLNHEDRQQWRDLICLLAWGESPQAIASNDLLAIAKTLEIEGLNSENPDLLRRAQAAYQRLNDETQAKLCQAQALKIERKFSQAGKLLLTQDQIKEAWDCFWEGSDWQNLVNMFNYNFEDLLTEDIQKVKPLINFMAWFIADDNITKINEQLKEFTVLISNESFNLKNLLRYPQWQTAIDAYIEVVKNIINSGKMWPPDQLRRIGYVLIHISHNASLPVRELAQSCLLLADKNKQNLNKVIQKVVESTQKDTLIKQELQLLTERQEYDQIIKKWENNRKPQEIFWLEYVIPAFEAKQCYKQAFVGYCLLKNYHKVKECFEYATNNRPSIKPLVILLRFYARNQYWTDLLSALNKYLPILTNLEAENTGLKYDFIYEIACSELTPQNLSKKDRDNYEKIIIKNIITNHQWQKYLLMQQLGIALEKIGAYDASFNFYQHYINSEDLKIKELARCRWLALKSKQEQELRVQLKINQFKKIRSEIEKQAEIWNINLTLINQEIPLAPPNRPELVAEQIIGLPQGIVVHTKENVVNFELYYLKIKLYKLIQQLTIKDTLTRKELRIDGKTKEIAIGTIVFQSQGGNILTFNEATRGYRGRLISFTNQALFELKIQNLAETIKFFL
jgi:hypothetical protein